MTTEWQRLFELAFNLIEQANIPHKIIDTWTFGGGTAMMLQIAHRRSHDVDIFLDDPQLLPFLNPATQGFSFATQPSAYSGDGSRFQKIVFDGLGEIDFIVAGLLTVPGYTTTTVLGRDVCLETVTEIISKKIFYRGSSIQARDVFDIAAACESGYGNRIIEALSSHSDKVKVAYEATEALNDDFLSIAISSLQIEDQFTDLPSRAKAICLDLLSAAADA